MTELTNPVGLADFNAILFENRQIYLSEETKERIQQSFVFLRDFAKDKIIYGVNTGFGPMAQYRINEADQVQLQYNLIRSHATGMGEKLSATEAKASLLARIQTLSLGHSGVHLSVVELMVEFLNRDIIPVIYRHGGVGASGDLVQLSHLALNVIGEGNVIYEGTEQPAAAVFAKEGLTPISIHLREGLALINGTSVMTGIGMVNALLAKRLFNWSIICSGMMN